MFRALGLMCVSYFVAIGALLVLGLSMTSAGVDHLLTAQVIAIFFLAVWFGSWVALMWKGDL